MISEVKDMKSHVLWALGKKTLKFHLELNFKKFQEKKDGKVLGWLLQHSHHWD